jgi:hypothetical protein
VKSVSIRGAQLRMTQIGAVVLALALGQAAPRAEAVDYAALYEQGIAYAAFVDGARMRAAEWRRGAAGAAADEGVLARLRELPRKRRLLVVAEASCSDSVATIPYLAKLVAAVPERLDMRIVNSKIGRAVMEAHRTPDNRAATPTVVVLDEDGRLLGAWSERPAALQQWYIDKKSSLTRAELLEQKTRWYADDAGKSATAEIVAILLGDRHEVRRDLLTGG